MPHVRQVKKQPSLSLCVTLNAASRVSSTEGVGPTTKDADDELDRGYHLSGETGTDVDFFYTQRHGS